MRDGAARGGAPIWIDAEQGPLFGFLHAPRENSSRSVAVVVVPPLGYEAICAHRTLRRLAERLAERGFFVLRYDHAGTGDSAGDGNEPGRVGAFLDGLARAIETVRARSRASGVALVGLRAGALLALAGAERRLDVSSVVLWAVPSTGKEYVRELRALGSLAGTGRRATPGPQEAAGFAYSADTLADLGRIDPRRLARPSQASVLLIPRDDVAAPDLHELGPWASGADLLTLPGYAEALRDPHESRVPEALLAGVGDWLARKHPYRLRRPHDPSPVPRVELRSRTRARRPIVEEAVNFGPDQRLFGIVTLPQRATPDRPCVLWLNAGATHHVGMNRNYVTFARAWAERGVTSLRFDGSGLGDSLPRSSGAENVLYSPEIVADVRSAMDFMQRAHGTGRFVLAGLCAGAYAAFHAALSDPRVETAVIINPQTFEFGPGDSMANRRRRAYRAARWYRRSVLRPESWRRALCGDVNLPRVGRLLAERLATYTHSLLAALKPGSSALATAFDALCSRGTKLLLVYSTEDPGLEHLRHELGSALERLNRDPRFALEIIDGSDHSFSPLESQARLSSCLESYIAGWHGVPWPENESGDQRERANHRELAVVAELLR